MSYPKRIEVVEVGPRDGFQNIKEVIATETKLEIIDSLVYSNLRRIQITSFVHPKAVPQMGDAEMICHSVVNKYPNVQFTALTPNLFGAKRAYAAGLKCITFVISASEEHNKANVNRTIQESLVDLEQLRDTLSDIDIQLDLATAFGCPFCGAVAMPEIMRIISQAVNFDINRICLCDTIGSANPLQLKRVICEVKDRYPHMPLSIHLHDTKGMGLANVLIAIQNGAATFEASVGGIGGCPFTPGASGNIATEDMVNMLESMGIETGVIIDNLIKAACLVKKKTQAQLLGHLSNIRCRDEINSETANV